MAIWFFTDGVKFDLKNKRQVKRWIRESVEKEKSKLGNVSVIFTSDQKILEINKNFLSHNFHTDTITFNYCKENIINGEMYISVETVKNNSLRFNVSFSEEILRVIIHGILHLIGYNDTKDEERATMREKENFYLERLKNLS